MEPCWSCVKLFLHGVVLARSCAPVELFLHGAVLPSGGHRSAPAPASAEAARPGTGTHRAGAAAGSALEPRGRNPGAQRCETPGILAVSPSNTLSLCPSP